jgi:hypothetical protein
MALYVTVREGKTAADTEPVLATGDKRIVQAVLDALARIALEANVVQDGATPQRMQRTSLHGRVPLALQAMPSGGEL